MNSQQLYEYRKRENEIEFERQKKEIEEQRLKDDYFLNKKSKELKKILKIK